MTSLDQNTLKKILQPNPHEMIREILEDFEMIGTRDEVVLSKRKSFPQEFKRNIYSAIVATVLRLSSIDYAKKTYCETVFDDEDDNLLHVKYNDTYKAAKNYIQQLRLRLVPDEKQEPSHGVFGASLVLERLPASLFGAHLLYRLGNRYEGHAVSRLMLEQIAWAYAAHTLTEIQDIKRIVTTKSVSLLNKIVPWCGKFYGFLSNKTHIDYGNHNEFLSSENGKNMVVHGHGEYYEYAQVILYLADLFSIVWEISQYRYLTQSETVTYKDNIYSIRDDRPFLKTISHHLGAIKDVAQENGLIISYKHLLG
jgi:hypothetical protein